MRDLRRFNRRLQRRHPLVRVRWSDKHKVYVLEEKARYGRLNLDPRSYPADAVDTFIQHRDGYTTVEFFRALPDVSRLADALEASRVVALLQRAGAKDSDELGAVLDAEYAAKYERNRAAFRDVVGEAASDEWDRAQWRTGSRVGGRHVRSV